MVAAHAGPTALSYEDSVTRFVTPEEATNRGVILRYDKRSLTLIDGLSAGQTVEYWVPIFEIDGGLVVSGTVALDTATHAALEHISVDNFPATQPVSGTVAVSNFPATQPVSGPLTDTQLRATPVPVSVGNFPATQPVSGTVAVSNLPATQPVSGTVAVSNFPATQPVSGTVAITATAATNASTTAYAASLVAKATFGEMWGLTGYNSKTSAQFIQIHDSATLPADTAVPKVIFLVPAQSPFSIEFGIHGRFFAAGIVVCNSSTGPTKTIGSADCWFDVQYT